MGKMVDLKLTKADKKAEEKRWSAEDPGHQYPYGSNIHFDELTVDKIPALQEVSGGDEIILVARCVVKGVNIRDDESKKNPSRQVEIQMRQVQFRPATDENDFASAFAEDE